MTNNLKHIFWGLLVIIPFFYACDKDKSDLGLSSINRDNLLSVHTDSTVTFKISTVADNEIRSGKFSYMLGSYSDPITGKHKASFATRFYLDSLKLDLLKYELDYISLRMYDTSYYYGDKSKQQLITISELTETLDSLDFADYYGSAIKPEFITSAQKIGDIAYTPQLSAKGGLEYRLPDAYAQELFTRIQSLYTLDTTMSYFEFLKDTTIKLNSLLDTTKQFADGLLTQEFKGLYFSTDYEGAAIVRYYSPQILIYLKTAEDKRDTLRLYPSPTAYNYDAPEDSLNVYLQSLSVFDHEIPNAISSKYNVTDAETYIQGNAGLKTKITFDNLETWRDSSVVINSAVLRVPIKNTDTTDYPLPPAVNFRVVDSDGLLVYSTISVAQENYEYVFNCQYFVTLLFNDVAKANEYSFSISVPENNIYSNRVLLDGSDLSKLKFTITYTK